VDKMTENVKKRVAGVFNEVAAAIESGEFGDKKKIGLTLLDSEHGVDELKKAAEIAENNYNDLEVDLIGCEEEKCSCLADAHSIMDQKLDNNELDAAVTLHYSFPLGVSTVGRVVTPGQGKEMLITTTT